MHIYVMYNHARMSAYKCTHMHTYTQTYIHKYARAIAVTPGMTILGSDIEEENDDGSFGIPLVGQSIAPRHCGIFNKDGKVLFRIIFVRLCACGACAWCLCAWSVLQPVERRDESCIPQKGASECYVSYSVCMCVCVRACACT
jgi:hypothetical protein